MAGWGGAFDLCSFESTLPKTTEEGVCIDSSAYETVSCFKKGREGGNNATILPSLLEEQENRTIKIVSIPWDFLGKQIERFPISYKDRLYEN